MSPPRWQRALIALLIAAFAISWWPGTAQAATSVAGGRLDWGVKSSFSTYITGPVANGSISLGGGAGTTGTNQYRFHSATGQYDSNSGDFAASYGGSVRFIGHQRDDGSYELDLTIANPSVEISGGVGTLYVDVDAHGNFQSRVPFGSLQLGGLNTAGLSGSIAISNVPVILTTQGAQSFAGYYEAGQELDAVSFTGDLATESTPSPDPTESEDDEDEEFSGAALDWGVRQTFREFVNGDIAQGGWQVTDGAEDGGAVFRFGSGTGTLTDDELTAAFTGTLTFTGTNVDLTISDPTVVVDDDRGVMTATVTGGGENREDVELVTFDVPDLLPTDGLLWLSEVPTSLTADGAEAMAGFYSEGTAMDPLSIAIPMSDDVELPPLPDLGAEPTTSIAPEPVADAETSDAEGPGLPVIIGAALIAAVVAGAGWWLIARRRRAAATRAEDPESTSDTDGDTDSSGDTAPTTPGTP
ncbi:Htaa protein [Stackebrandtia endophytica]|uniref:Htaa protein n=1 Tax=Stackebrandtia endophytica TaxID=1496996 RepID=A0A543ATX8_9ACTN|nr:HtaA domain-containing protein [Stackebrandtia endophytica]TQL76041.1 Htaa protein [Stackebrandtia endophytica]